MPKGFNTPCHCHGHCLPKIGVRYNHVICYANDTCHQLAVYYCILSKQESITITIKISVMPGDISMIKSVRRIRTFPFSYNSVAHVPLITLTSENRIARVGSRSGTIRQSQCTFPCFVIGLFLLLPLATLKTRLVNERVVIRIRRIRTLLALDHKVLRFWLRLWLHC